MKKLSFFAVAMFVGGVAFAQNNTSTTTQNGDNNSADIEQTGSGNTSTLTQTKNNEFELVQDGDDNLSNFRQANNGGNKAFINQLGDRNKVTRGGGALQGSNNLAHIDQGGNDNTAIIYQDFKNNELNFDQDGNGNYAKANQDGGVAGSILTVNQVGDNNRSDDGFQKNGFNSANTQITGSDNWTETHQNGDLNTVTIDINGSGNGNVGVGASGDDYISVTQGGDNNTADIDIIGSYNDVDISQSGTGGHEATVLQTGDLNIGTISQDGADHTGYITQTGSGNTASVVQSN